MSTEERVSRAAALFRAVVPDFSVVSATRVSESSSVVVRLAASDVTRAVARLRARFPLWTCVTTTSHAHGRDLVHILLPDDESCERAAAEGARACQASRQLRRLALALLVVALLLPVAQLAYLLAREESVTPSVEAESECAS